MLFSLARWFTIGQTVVETRTDSLNSLSCSGPFCRDAKVSKLVKCATTVAQVKGLKKKRFSEFSGSELFWIGRSDKKSAFRDQVAA